MKRKKRPVAPSPDPEAITRGLLAAREIAEHDRAQLLAKGGEAAILSRVLAFLHPHLNLRDVPYSHAYTWWAFLTGLHPQEPGVTWSSEDRTGRTPIEQIEKLQAGLRAGVKKLLAGGTWDLPTPPEASIRRLTATPNWSAVAPRSSGAAPPPPATYQWWWRMTDPASMAVFALASLIRDHGQRLRACAVCGAQFLAVKRQVYCGPACTKTGQRPRKTEA